MAKRKKPLSTGAPLLYPDHPLPKSRRDFLRAGLLTGGAYVTTGGLLGLISEVRKADAAVAADLQDLASSAGCPISAFAGQRVPFICFDLAGGANIAGSNVIVGNQGPNGQMETIGTRGQNKLGVNGDEVPGLVDGNADPNRGDLGDFTNNAFGLLFHSNSSMLSGMLASAPTFPTNVASGTSINGAVIPARSANDTQNNQHNPMYGIARAGASGEVVTLIGSRNSDSGGNSMAPLDEVMNFPDLRPTKVDSPNDVVGLVDVGNLTAVLDKTDLVAVMQASARISNAKLGRVDTLQPNDAAIKNLVRCANINAANIADTFAGVQVDPRQDLQIVGDATSIFTQADFDGTNDRRAGSEYRKTASVMKMVLERNAGAGCIAMGGYDYHTGDRTTGDRRDFIAGRCIGAVLDYARRLGSPVMIYVFSDGSVFSNGTEDNNNGRLVWTGDNSAGGCSFFLVFDPSNGIRINTASGVSPQQMQQIGFFNDNGDVVRTSSPMADGVLNLVDYVILNYMALNNEKAGFTGVVGSSALASNIERYAVFNNII